MENSGMNVDRVCISVSPFFTAGILASCLRCASFFITRRPFQVCNNNLCARFLFLLVDVRALAQGDVLCSTLSAHDWPWTACDGNCVCGDGAQPARWRVGQQQPQRGGHQGLANNLENRKCILGFSLNIKRFLWGWWFLNIWRLVCDYSGATLRDAIVFSWAGWRFGF